MLNGFRLRIILSIMLLLANMGLITLCWLNQQYYVASLLLFLLAFQAYLLIRYVEKTNRDLSRFFQSARYNDFTLNPLPEGKGDSFVELVNGFNLINEKFLEVRAEKEANHQFLQTLVKNIEIGLLGINAKGEVMLMNQALQKLLQKSYLVTLDSLQKVDEKLWQFVRDLPSGQRELIKLSLNNNLLHLSIQCAELIMQGQAIKLYAFQDIQNELEAQELIAWQKLIRILTHEIMNSVAPISSLSATLQQLLQDKQSLNQQELDNVRKSMAVIERRSEGLLSFTETYRTLTRIPPPQFRVLRVDELFDEVATLLQAQLDAQQITLEKELSEPDLQFNGDPHLLEQVLINLIKNAKDALEEREDATIKLSAFRTREGKLCLQVKDNGAGIPADKMEEIFVPFFTTKEHGSGIGLSLSRQIIRMHKGSLELQSKEGEGTVVSILL
ncbi:MAG: ATP-binding protein [Bacteroidota bacterium]